MKIIYRLLQKIKIKRAENMGVPIPGGLKPMEHRKYLTLRGLTEWRDLTLDDKLRLNIKI